MSTGGPVGTSGPEPEGGATFESLLGELEAVTDRLARGDVGIEAAADLYERAEELHRQASARLDAVTARIEARRADRERGPAPEPPLSR